MNQVNVKHYNVEHSSVSHRLSPDVSPRRLNPALFETNARKRKGDTVLAPALLSNRQQTKRRIQFQRSTSGDDGVWGAQRKCNPSVDLR